MIVKGRSVGVHLCSPGCPIHRSSELFGTWHGVFFFSDAGCKWFSPFWDVGFEPGLWVSTIIESSAVNLLKDLKGYFINNKPGLHNITGLQGWNQTLSVFGVLLKVISDGDEQPAHPACSQQFSIASMSRSLISRAVALTSLLRRIACPGWSSGSESRGNCLEAAVRQKRSVGQH